MVFFRPEISLVRPVSPGNERVVEGDLRRVLTSAISQHAQRPGPKRDAVSKSATLVAAGTGTVKVTRQPPTHTRTGTGQRRR